MKHTPGPWTVHETPEHLYGNSPDHAIHVFGANGGYALFTRHFQYGQKKQGSKFYRYENFDTVKANMRLAAAAPELLEALQIAAGFIESGESCGYDFFEVRAAWRRAFAKAEGVTE